MRLLILSNRQEIGKAAAAEAAAILVRALAARGSARMVAATGTSQFEFLDALSVRDDIAWARVELFHLDEYVGLPADHPASFRRFLRERLIDRTGLERVHFIDGEGDPDAVIEDLGRAVRAAPLDLACVGIGENGHLAFNEPPADFQTAKAFTRVALDETSRRQQMGEGWFAKLADVPTHAITMTIPQILQAEHIICLAPDARKAEAVAACLSDGVRPEAPASALLRHPRTTVYLDEASAARLSGRVRAGS